MSKNSPANISNAIFRAYADKIPADERDNKALDWSKSILFNKLDIPAEIHRAAAWEFENRPGRRGYKNKLRFIGNWLLREAGNPPKSPEAEALLKFWNDRFRNTHKGLDYEQGSNDVKILNEIQKRRGLIETFILVDAYYQKAVDGWKYFPQAPRDINSWKSQINKILADPKVQDALKNRIHQVRHSLETKGFI